jgi:hypothetical protein
MATRLKLVTLPAITIAAAGTPQQVSLTSISVYEVILVSHPDNTGLQAVGDEYVDAATNRGGIFGPAGSYELSPPENMRATDTIDLQDVYVDSTTTGAIITILAWIRG